VLRSPAELAHLLRHLDAGGPRPGVQLSPAAVEATNLHTVSVLVATAASIRAESRGCHRRSDVTGPVTSWQRRVELTLDAGQLPLGTVAAMPGRAAVAA
jgi:L-aspartate oxidase